MKKFLNILPPEKKALLVKMKIYRFFVRQALGILTLTILVLLLTLGIRFLLYIEERSMTDSILKAGQEHEGYAEIMRYEEGVKEARALTDPAKSVLASQKKVVWVFEALERSIEYPNITLTSIIFEDNALKLSGTADTRDSLLELQKRLRETECFVDAVVPWSQIAKRNSIDFEITVTLDQQCL